MVGKERAPEGVVRVRAPNPSPLTLDGTNTYVVGRWVVDPGPADDEHLGRVLEAAADRGAGGGAARRDEGPLPLDGIVLTHDHPDHADGAPALARKAGGVPIVLPRGGERVGPFEAIATPGHVPDHVCLLHGRALFTGDTVLGEGSVFIAPGEGSLSAYLDSLCRLLALKLDVLCPGHGPFVWRPRARIEEQLEHRLDRERGLLEALANGARATDELLDAAWSEVPDALRPAAALTLAAHLDKLAEEGRLPPDVERSVTAAANARGSLG